MHNWKSKCVRRFYCRKASSIVRLQCSLSHCSHPFLCFCFFLSFGSSSTLEGGTGPTRSRDRRFTSLVTSIFPFFFVGICLLPLPPVALSRMASIWDHNLDACI